MINIIFAALLSIFLNSPPRMEEIEKHVPLKASVEPTLKVIDTNNRQTVIDFYNNSYLNLFIIPAGWTGEVPSCNAGNVYSFYNLSTVQTINYFRVMCGLPELFLDNFYTQKCQESSLIMFANNILTHQPTNDLLCWTAFGAEAAASSNIGWGGGPVGVLSCMNEGVYGNYEVGHRRWFLFPPSISVGSGSVYESYYNGVNTIWVLTPFGIRPSLPEFVSWPSKGYVPYPVVFAKWSFSLKGANFSQSSVKMKKIGGSSISLVRYPLAYGYGDPTIVWLPSLAFNQGMSDKTYEVTIKDVNVGGQIKNYIYRVTVIDPGPAPVFTPYLTPTPSLSVSPSPSTTPSLTLTISKTPTQVPNYSIGWEWYE